MLAENAIAKSAGERPAGQRMESNGRLQGGHRYIVVQRRRQAEDTLLLNEYQSLPRVLRNLNIRKWLV